MSDDDDVKPCPKCGGTMTWEPLSCDDSVWECPDCGYREVEEYDPDCEEDAGCY